MTNLFDDDPKILALTKTLSWWFGNDISTYVDRNSVLRWEVANNTQETSLQEISWSGNSASISEDLERRIEQQRKLEDVEVYIPSERALYSFLPPYVLSSRFLAAEDWPGYISTFYETLGRTVDWLYRHQDASEKTSDTFLSSRIETIFKGQIKYLPSTVALKVKTKTFPITAVAGGQMEAWPFWAIVEAGFRSDRLRSARIYFDEPEAHLHPAAQRIIIEMIAYLVNHSKTQYVLATHSPFVLYTINLLIKAHEIRESGHLLPKEIPLKAILSPEQIAAYRFPDAGIIQNIKDPITNLIDEDELDQVADDLGAIFTDLLEKQE
jgi:hypothetical protein